MDGNVTNLFECIREDPEKLARSIYLTPYSRQVYEKAFHEVPEDKFEAALNFYIRLNMGHGFRTTGEMLGFDTYEHDYYGLDSFESRIANEEAVKKMKRLTKDQLIETAQICFRVYKSYIGLQYRYDCIKAALDILKDEDTGYLQMVRQIEEAYEKADEETDGFRWTFKGGPALKMLENLIDSMPQEVWVQ